MATGGRRRRGSSRSAPTAASRATWRRWRRRATRRVHPASRRCDVLTPACAQSRAEAVLCPAELGPAPNEQQP